MSKRAKVVQPPSPVFNPVPGMTSKQWRQSEEARLSASKLFRTQEFQAMLSILINERPGRMPLPMTADAQMLASQAMFVAGYEFFLNQMLSLAEDYQEMQPSYASPMDFTED